MGRFYSTDGVELLPRPAQVGGPPIWIGSWGSDTGLRRTAATGRRLAGVGLQHHTGPVRAWPGPSSQELLATEGKDSGTFPNALATMWFHITDDTVEADQIFRRRLAPTINRPEDVLRERLPVGPAPAFAEKLCAFAEAGVQRVLVWPVADEERQLELFCEQVTPPSPSVET